MSSGETFNPPMRQFQTDFLGPAIVGLTPDQAVRVARAMDCAIAFGALESLEGNTFLGTPSKDDLVRGYWFKVAQLQGLLS